MSTPDPVWLITNSLLGCLVAGLLADGRPVCSSCVYHGQTRPPADQCGCDCQLGTGHAWVRVVRAAVARAGEKVTASGAACVTVWQMTLEIGVYRCVAAVPDPDGNPPGCAETSADAQMASADARIMREITTSCTTLEDLPVRVQGWDPVGPSGGCGGSAMTLVIEL